MTHELLLFTFTIHHSQFTYALWLNSEGKTSSQMVTGVKSNGMNGMNGLNRKFSLMFFNPNE